MAHLVQTNISSIIKFKRAFQNASHSVSAFFIQKKERKKERKLKFSSVSVKWTAKIQQKLSSDQVFNVNMI